MVAERLAAVEIERAELERGGGIAEPGGLGEEVDGEGDVRRVNGEFEEARAGDGEVKVATKIEQLTAERERIERGTRSPGVCGQATGKRSGPTSTQRAGVQRAVEREGVLRANHVGESAGEGPPHQRLAAVIRHRDRATVGLRDDPRVQP